MHILVIQSCNKMLYLRNGHWTELLSKEFVFKIENTKHNYVAKYGKNVFLQNLLVDYGRSKLIRFVWFWSAKCSDVAHFEKEQVYKAWKCFSFSSFHLCTLTRVGLKEWVNTAERLQKSCQWRPLSVHGFSLATSLQC